MKGRKRWLVAIGFALIAAAIFLLILAIIPTSRDSRLPNWISKVKPYEFHKGTEEFPTPPRAVEFITEARRIPLNMAEFSQRLRNDLRKKPEWHETTNIAAFPTWYRGYGDETGSLWAMPEGNGVVVHTNWTHGLTWLEKAQRNVLKLFGAKN